MNKIKLQEKNKNKGITLVALVITIVILIILATVAINFAFGESGLVTKANEAKIMQAVSSVKETIHLEALEREMDKEKLTPEIMLAEGKVTRTVQQGEDQNYHMYYALKDNAYEQMAGLGKGNLTELKDVFLIDDNLNIKYISKDGKEYGDNIEDKLLTDETEIKFSSEAFSKYVSKISGIAEDEMKFKWMKNQTSLTIADTSVDSLLDLVFFPNLTSLTLGDWKSNIPPITSMEGIENCTKLESLTILYGPDKDYSAVAKLDNLNVFYRGTGTDYNNIINALKLCQNLEKVTLRNVDMHDMEEIGELSNKLKYLELNYNKINEIKGLEDKVNLTYLNLGYNNLSNLQGLENLAKLETLNLNNNRITDITPLSANSSLMTLSLKGNTNIDGNRNNYTGEKLEALNKIGEILDRGGSINLDVDKLALFTNYTRLDLLGQNLTTLESIKGITSLEMLNLNSNSLTLEDINSQEILASMEKLYELNLANNNLTNITAINNLKKLNTLYLSGKNNKINLKEIEDIISNLDGLTVTTEQLKTIQNCDANKITKLNLGQSSLTEIPDLSKFTKLTKISLYNTPGITNFENVSQISSLQTLNITKCDLHNRMIDFSKLTNLTNLNLSGNTLWSEDLENLKALKNNTGLTIDLSNNSIVDASALLELNPSTKIKLGGNVNLTQESKTALQERFGSNVSF